MAGKYTGPRRELVIRDSDLIWMARMLVGEGGYKISEDEASAALWALANRYLLHPKQENWETFTVLLKAFSQPINPKWDGVPFNQAGEDFCSGGKYEGTEHCSPSKERRREKIRTLAWEDIPLRIRQWVGEFQNGVLFPPDKLTRLRKARISNWGAKWLKKRRDGQVMPLPEWAPWGIDFGGNWFFEDKNLIDGEIDVTSDPDSPAIKPPVSPWGVATVVALTGAGYLGTRLLMDYMGK
jgi:hypothetical protein